MALVTHLERSGCFLPRRSLFTCRYVSAGVCAPKFKMTVQQIDKDILGLVLLAIALPGSLFLRRRGARLIGVGAAALELLLNLTQSVLFVWRVSPPNWTLIGALFVNSAVCCWVILHHFRCRESGGTRGGQEDADRRHSPSHSNRLL